MTTLPANRLNHKGVQGYWFSIQLLKCSKFDTVIYFILFPILLYVVFWLTVWVLPFIRKKGENIHTGHEELTCGVIIPAFNEEDVIEKKIENTIEALRGVKKFSIYIGSDGSEDNTVMTADETSKNYPWVNIRIFD